MKSRTFHFLPSYFFRKDLIVTGDRKETRTTSVEAKGTIRQIFRNRFRSTITRSKVLLYIVPFAYQGLER